jgi:hypothetical protein
MKVVLSLATLLASRRVVKMIFFRPNNRPRHFKKTATFTVDRVPVCTLIVSVFNLNVNESYHNVFMKMYLAEE